MTKRFYLTTPIFYPSDNLHIGHTYTTVAADVLKKFKTIQGYDVFFVTGSDEHGQKIQQQAKKNGVSPKAYVDNIVADIKDLWKTLEIDYDVFIRSTDEHHKKVVKDLFTKLHDKGEIYKSVYEGHYCTPCESFWSDAQLTSEGHCPDCNRPVHLAQEEAYFFKLSQYKDRLLKLYEDNPEFIQPESRKNEMISFIKNGLDDLCVSRTSFDWGVKVPFDESHVVYVWIDALSCYLTALGYGGEDKSNFEKFWPANVHLVGKEIVRFHTIIWPALLMALDMPLPEKVFGHGWILYENDKMSKSKGNIIYPEPIIDLYGIDAFKYFLLREFTFGQDGSFSKENFLQRLNSDLANDLGNLVSRSIAMVDQYTDGIIPGVNKEGDFDADLSQLASTTAARVEEKMDKLNFSGALEEIWKLVRRTNKYIDETRPWVLIKEDKERLDTVLYNLMESIRIISVLIEPFLGKTSLEIRRQLGINEEINWEDSKEFGLIKPGVKVNRGQAIFPRLDIEKEMKRLDNANKNLMIERGTYVEPIEEVQEEVSEIITIDEFDKIKLKTAEIVSCEDHPKADRLYVLRVKIGEEERQIVSGLKESYKAEDLVGKKVVVITNLKPVKLRGVESNGMVLAAEDIDGKLSLLTTLEDIKSGATIS